MTLETFLLFAALAVLTALGTWLNIRSGDWIMALFSALMILAGTGGMVYLVAVALFA